MRRIRYVVAASLDGYIAGPNGEADWIITDPDIDSRALFEPASFSDSLTIVTLRFARVVATNSPKDFHLQVSAHAGHTKNGGASAPPFSPVPFPTV